MFCCAGAFFYFKKEVVMEERKIRKTIKRGGINFIKLMFIDGWGCPQVV